MSKRRNGNGFDRSIDRLQTLLEDDLEGLKASTGLGGELTVKWNPNYKGDRHGEVQGNVIYIYDLDEEKARRTLRHEFIDYHISKEVVDPLIKYLNLQKSLIEDLIYERKEKLIEKIINIMRLRTKQIQIE